MQLVYFLSQEEKNTRQGDMSQAVMEVGDMSQSKNIQQNGFKKICTSVQLLKKKINPPGRDEIFLVKK